MIERTLAAAAARIGASDIPCTLPAAVLVGRTAREARAMGVDVSGDVPDCAVGRPSGDGVRWEWIALEFEIG